VSACHVPGRSIAGRGKVGADGIRDLHGHTRDVQGHVVRRKMLPLQ
jgi:hypothetical protein